AFSTVFLPCRANASGEHNDLVGALRTVAIFVLESQQASADQKLSKFVAEIRGSSSSTNKNFCGGVIQPFARFDSLFPRSTSFQTRVGGDVHRRACEGKRSLSASEAVANFAT